MIAVNDSGKYLFDNRWFRDSRFGTASTVLQTLWWVENRGGGGLWMVWKGVAQGQRAGAGSSSVRWMPLC